ncbi:cysteine peptidase family C39 domain-containing protein [Arabiibacter massiliensis]|uniref:hypothetical protein n=1 Tax=Arabiibacter massiliensis TaxID=1870985 RepID=UPI001E5D2E38|nr:hypothetical protein [Arabiibacter massiliensis]
MARSAGASERRSIPNRTHGVSYPSSAHRSTPIRTYPSSGAVRPAAAAPIPHPARDRVDARRVLAAVLVLLLVGIASALVGIAVARALVGFVDEGTLSGSDNVTRAESLSDPQSTWEQGSAPALYQDDPHWADRPYGPSTIGAAGAAPLCLAMARIDVLGDVQTGPIDVASFSQRSGYADAADASALLTDGAAELGLAARSVRADERAVRLELVAGRPLVAAVKAGAFGDSPTYIVFADIDPRGKLIVNDPLSSERSARHWRFEEVLPETTALWSFEAAE